MLDADQEVLDEDDILLLGEVLQVSPLLVQRKHRFPLRRHLVLELLVLFDLDLDGLQHPGHGLKVAKRLFSLSQPVDESLL